jgi:tRNA A37 methylthiotransferase MiaB
VTKRIPGIGLGTDLIVRFPGEREEDFTRSVDLIQNSPLQYAHVFVSHREKIVATLMKDQIIDPKTIERRAKILRNTSRDKY